MSNYIIKYSDSREYMEALDTSLGRIFYSPFTKHIHVEWIEKRHEFNDTEVILELYNRLFAYMRENLYQNFGIFFETVYADESEMNIVLRLKKRYENNSSARLASRCVNFKFSIKPKFMPIALPAESRHGLNRPQPSSRLPRDGTASHNYFAEQHQQHIHATVQNGRPASVGEDSINQRSSNTGVDVPAREGAQFNAEVNNNNCSEHGSDSASSNDRDSGDDTDNDYYYYSGNSNEDNNNMADDDFYRTAAVEQRQSFDLDYRANVGNIPNEHRLNDDAAKQHNNNNNNNNRQSMVVDEETISSGMLNKFGRMACEATASGVQSQWHRCDDNNPEQASIVDNGNGRTGDDAASVEKRLLNVDAETVSSGMLKRFRRMDHDQSVTSSMQSRLGRLYRFDTNNAKLLIHLCNFLLEKGEIPPHSEPIFESIEIDLVQYVDLPVSERSEYARLPLSDDLIARARDRFIQSASVEDAASLLDMLKARVTHLKYQAK